MRISSLLFAPLTMILMSCAVTLAQKHQVATAVGPKLVPCVFAADRPEVCQARIQADVVKGSAPREINVVVRTINLSKKLIFVQESNPLDDLDLQVKDLWGNPVPFTEKELKRRSPRSRYRSTLNHWEPLATGGEDIQKFTLSDVFSIEQPGWYTLIVSQLIYRSDFPKGFESILELAQSAPISFKVDAEETSH